MSQALQVRVLLIDDESFAQDIIAHGLKGCVGHQLCYESNPARAS